MIFKKEKQPYNTKRHHNTFTPQYLSLIPAFFSRQQQQQPQKILKKSVIMPPTNIKIIMNQQPTARKTQCLQKRHGLQLGLHIG